MSFRGARTFNHRSNPLNVVPFIPQLPLDLFLFDSFYCNVYDDQDLVEFLSDINTQLTSSAENQQMLGSLFNAVCKILDAVIINPVKFEGGQIDQVRPVGSFKLGTWLNVSNVADLVCIFRTLPTKEAVLSLIKLMRTELPTNLDDSLSKQVVVKPQKYGLSVSSGEFVVQIMVSTTGSNIGRIDSEIHIDAASQKIALAAVRHTRWLEENATHSTIKLLTKIVKDFRRRFKGFNYLNSWLIDLFVHYVVMNNSTRQPLPINQAFRRLLYLLSAGFFMPGSAGIVDPFEPGNVRIHTTMTLMEQDELCCTAQTLLRILLHGGYKLLFAFNELEDSAGREKFLKQANFSLMHGDDIIKWSKNVIINTNAGATPANNTTTYDSGSGNNISELTDNEIQT